MLNAGEQQTSWQQTGQATAINYLNIDCVFALSTLTFHAPVRHFNNQVNMGCGLSAGGVGLVFWNYAYLDSNTTFLFMTMSRMLTDKCET